MTALEFMARLAAIIAPPRYPLTRFAGVLAPRSKWRREVVPKPREGRDGCDAARGDKLDAARAKPNRPKSGDAAAQRPASDGRGERADDDVRFAHGRAGHDLDRAAAAAGWSELPRSSRATLG
jgi:hypothetical protein